MNPDNVLLLGTIEIILVLCIMLWAFDILLEVAFVVFILCIPGFVILGHFLIKLM